MFRFFIGGYMIKEIFQELSKFDCVEAIAIGGSRASKVYDKNSDYDIYVYVTDW